MTSDHVGEALEQLAPAQPFLADWEDVRRRAGSRPLSWSSRAPGAVIRGSSWPTAAIGGSAIPYS
jgi:hypothetical protein